MKIKDDVSCLTLAVFFLGSSFAALCAQDDTSSGQARADSDSQAIVLKVRVHLLESNNVPELNTELTEKEVASLFIGVNHLWEQARITWEIESVVKESPVKAMEERFVELLRKQREDSKDSEPGVYSLKGAREANEVLEGIYSKETRFANGWNLYVASDLGAMFGGLYQARHKSILFDSEGSQLYQVALLAHELGHSLSLAHAEEELADNLMLEGGPLKPDVCIRLTPEQITAARKQASLGKPFGVEQRIQAIFMARDKNKDGVLTPGERGFLWRLDANGDGRVELIEFQRAKSRQTFSDFDTNQDGLITRDEASTFLLRTADTNKDGRVDADEFRQRGVGKQTIRRPLVDDAKQAETVLGQRVLGLGMKSAGDEGDGLVVTRILRGSKGEAAGIKVGDRVIRIGGKPTDTIAQLRKAVREGGKQQKVVVVQSGNEIELTVEFDK